jgi:hypothetical protein
MSTEDQIRHWQQEDAVKEYQNDLAIKAARGRAYVACLELSRYRPGLVCQP